MVVIGSLSSPSPDPPDERSQDQGQEQADYPEQDPVAIENRTQTSVLNTIPAPGHQDKGHHHSQAHDEGGDVDSDQNLALHTESQPEPEPKPEPKPEPALKSGGELELEAQGPRSSKAKVGWHETQEAQPANVFAQHDSGDDGQADHVRSASAGGPTRERKQEHEQKPLSQKGALPNESDNVTVSSQKPAHEGLRTAHTPALAASRADPAPAPAPAPASAAPSPASPAPAVPATATSGRTRATPPASTAGPDMNPSSDDPTASSASRNAPKTVSASSTTRVRPSPAPFQPNTSNLTTASRRRTPTPASAAAAATTAAPATVNNAAPMNASHTKVQRTQPAARPASRMARNVSSSDSTLSVKPESTTNSGRAHAPSASRAPAAKTVEPPATGPTRAGSTTVRNRPLQSVPSHKVPVSRAPVTNPNNNKAPTTKPVSRTGARQAPKPGLADKKKVSSTTVKAAAPLAVRKTGLVSAAPAMRRRMGVPMKTKSKTSATQTASGSPADSPSLPDPSAADTHNVADNAGSRSVVPCSTSNVPVPAGKTTTSSATTSGSRLTAPTAASRARAASVTRARQVSGSTSAPPKSAGTTKGTSTRRQPLPRPIFTPVPPARHAHGSSPAMGKPTVQRGGQENRARIGSVVLESSKTRAAEASHASSTADHPASQAASHCAGVPTAPGEVLERHEVDSRPLSGGQNDPATPSLEAQQPLRAEGSQEPGHPLQDRHEADEKTQGCRPFPCAEEPHVAEKQIPQAGKHNKQQMAEHEPSRTSDEREAQVETGSEPKGRQVLCDSAPSTQGARLQRCNEPQSSEGPLPTFTAQPAPADCPGSSGGMRRDSVPTGEDCGVEQGTEGQQGYQMRDQQPPQDVVQEQDTMQNPTAALQEDDLSVNQTEKMEATARTEPEAESGHAPKHEPEYAHEHEPEHAPEHAPEYAPEHEPDQHASEYEPEHESEGSLSQHTESQAFPEALPGDQSKTQGQQDAHVSQQDKMKHDVSQEVEHEERPTLVQSAVSEMQSQECQSDTEAAAAPRFPREVAQMPLNGAEVHGTAISSPTPQRKSSGQKRSAEEADLPSPARKNCAEEEEPREHKRRSLEHLSCSVSPPSVTPNGQTQDTPDDKDEQDHSMAHNDVTTINISSSQSRLSFEATPTEPTVINTDLKSHDDKHVQQGSQKLEVGHQLETTDSYKPILGIERANKSPAAQPVSPLCEQGADCTLASMCLDQMENRMYPAQAASDATAEESKHEKPVKPIPAATNGMPNQATSSSPQSMSRPPSAVPSSSQSAPEPESDLDASHYSEPSLHFEGLETSGNTPSRLSSPRPTSALENKSINTPPPVRAARTSSSPLKKAAARSGGRPSRRSSLLHSATTPKSAQVLPSSLSGLSSSMNLPTSPAPFSNDVSYSGSESMVLDEEENEGGSEGENEEETIILVGGFQ